MAHFDDLSPYEYSEHGMHEGTVNVGWLSAESDYQQGNASNDFIERLLLYCLHPLVRTRGFHRCELCSKTPPGPLVFEYGSESLRLGTAEIRVFDSSGRIYAAPDLILHYAYDHDYAPPFEFVDAVLTSELPGTDRYQELVRRLGLDD